MISSKYLKFALFSAIILLQSLSVSAPSFAQENDTRPPLDILPATTAQERGIVYDDQTHTHPAIKLTPDKSELVRLDRPAASIIVGNPNHLSILADTSQTLVLVARAPGATQFTVLDKNGAIVMQRHVIVASPKEKYMRIRRSCAGSDDDTCQSTSVFYCPDMCHEIIMGSEEADSNAGALVEGGNTNTNEADALTSPPAEINDTE